METPTGPGDSRRDDPRPAGATRSQTILDHRCALTYVDARMESVSRVGLVLRAARERRGWTLTELAEHSGITRQSIAKIEEGHPRGEIGIVSQLASTLGFELAVLEIPGSEHHMNLIGRLRARADKSSRESVLARGVYGSQLASQVPDDVLQHRALHLVRHWAHAARYSNSWVLAGALPSQVYRILSAGDPTSPEVLNLCAYPMPYLFVRLAVEHPWWLATRPQTSATLDDRRDLACIVAKYGTQPAPDHRGQLINHNKRIRTQAASTSHWLSASSNALDALNPALAQEIANALARELWGRWILQDLQLHAFPHERGDDTTQYFVTDAPNGARGRYRGEPAFAAATHWPEAEAEQLADDGWTDPSRPRHATGVRISGDVPPGHRSPRG